MGKSTVSCFKFIACGSDSVDHHDLPTPESKDQSDRRGWSFRKRSPKQRVLSNSATSEAPSSANKESIGTSVINFPVQPDMNVLEKTLLANGTKEKGELPCQLDSKLSDAIAAKDEECGDATYDESSIIVFQAAIRGFLARQVLLKQKNIIILQAVVRGHIIRSYARGTLRCILAIVKMQALVRARQAKNESALLGKKNAKHSGTYISIEKLLRNAFARQLMESTSRPTNIKCEPSKSDAAWKWLERWMSISSVTIKESVESGLPAEHRVENIEHCDGNRSISIPSECYAEPTDSGSGVVVSTEVTKNDGSLITNDTNDSDPCAKLHSVDQSNSSFDATEFDHIEIKETDLVEEIEEKSLRKEEINEHCGPDSEKLSIEKDETEARKVSRKASNPAFIAAQSKFEELSSGVAPVKLSTPSNDDQAVESKDDVLHDNTFSTASAVQIGDFECGTQLSISSTLDSPERSESAVNDTEHETKFSEDANHHRSTESLDPEASGMSMIPETHQSCTDSTKQEEEDENINPVTIEYLNSITADSPLPETKPEPESSLRSHVTVPESQATPSSQVSVKPKKGKGEKTGSTRKNKSLSADKNSLPNRSQDAALRSSLDEHLLEQNTGKKRNSIDSDKHEHEPRDNSNNNGICNSLPSYMQATESARAKAIANGSPRSSPDVLDRDVYLKKRHSLPGANDRQRSPRIQRPQQNGKGNLTHSPQERKWRR